MCPTNNADYAGDVWDVQPTPKDHVLRTTKNLLSGGNGMVPHYSGTTLNAQVCYAKGVRNILKNYLQTSPRSLRISLLVSVDMKAKPVTIL